MRYRPFALLGVVSNNVAVLKAAIPVVVLAGIWLLAIAGAPEPPSARFPSSHNAYSPARLPPASSQQCLSCHHMEPAFSHPVGVTPTMAVPENLPLESGKIACLTCHEDGSSAAHERARQYQDAMLRGSLDGVHLCTQCHTDTRRTANAMHAMALNRAHLNTPSRGLPAVAFPGALDAQTQNCMTCHDGTLATEVNTRTAGAIGTTTRGDHPIGVVYPEGSGRPIPLGDSFLMPRNQLDPRIRLFDGQVGCGTCHSPYSTAKKQLVISNLGSKLCLSCHIL